MTLLLLIETERGGEGRGGEEGGATEGDRGPQRASEVD